MMTDKETTQTSSTLNPMEDNLIHTLLVGSNRLQSLPMVVIALLIAILSGVVYTFWSLSGSASDGLAVALIYGVMSVLDWLGLWLLPRLGRSYGPDRPSALALAILRAVIVIIVGLLALPWWIAAAFSIALSLLAFYATWIEPFNLGVTYEQLITDKWPIGTKIRLLHIGDIHIERITRRELKLNQLIKELQPDIIVFSGDFVNISYQEDRFTEAAIRNIISAWSAPLGVYCVPGTYTVETPERVKEFTLGLDNLRLLLDEWVTIEVGESALDLLGMVTTHILETDRAKVTLFSRFTDDEGVKLMLTHAPDVAPEAAAAGFDLYLCGHTHGGQIRLPLIGAIFSGGELGRRFVMGRYKLDNMTLYTSRGVGLEGLGAPRARFLCPPEIILWEIKGQQ
ncbi:MAG: metallophosphoesterase [Chitinophagaceae bacterium]|nr:metallophosphoesterase [Anaerolineae bacterium]